MYESEFRQLHPSTSFPQQISEAALNDFGADVVFEGPQASGGTVYQYSVYGGVEQLDGKWYTKWNLGPSFFDTQDADGRVTTAAENEAAYKAFKDAEQANAVRTSRNIKLDETDWRYRRDQTTTPAWDAYCQALRDVPAQAGFPWTIDWPVEPQ
jgi:hypothetical protein